MTKLLCPLHFAGSASPQKKYPRTTKANLGPAELYQPITVLKGVGPAAAAYAAKLGITVIKDLLFHFPYRHEDFTSSSRIGELKWGEEATVTCRLESIMVKPTRRRNLRLVVGTVSDETGYMEALWFNQSYLAGSLKPGDMLMLRGSYEGASRAFRVKSHELLGGEGAGLHTAGLVPVYSTTEKISVKRLRGWIDASRYLAAGLIEPLPAKIRADLDLPRRADAVLAMHFPRTPDDWRAARRRLAFEELFLMQLGLLSHRSYYEKRYLGVTLGAEDGFAGAFVSGLPFRLTADQTQACREISSDLESGRPMQRLLQGDVGSGKTAVAVYALLRAVDGGCQAALMAPTEVLAEQHVINLKRMLSGLRIKTALLSSRIKTPEKRQLLADIKSGAVDLVVGTHALIQEQVDFKRLGVVVVDEQHRFGVRQREELAQKATRGGVTPHVLHMTATPIPRTLALTLYGDLDVSTLKSMPPGRGETLTRLVPEAKRAEAYDFIRKQLDRGRQCYVVCPLIEESEAVQARAVAAEADRLSQVEFKGYRLKILHGQMPADEKQKVMAGFQAGEIQVLVSTTVIEVGVDVANATVMLVEEADRFGLAQLHQLRGRVGRGRHRSYCFLFGEGRTEAAQRRLEAMASTGDGFKLADIDLEIRGEGQLFGIRQSGLPDLRLARLTVDQGLLGQARESAKKVIGADPGLGRSENQLLRDEVEHVFGDSVEWLRRM